MTTLLASTVAVIVGYVASIFTWAAIRQSWLGVESEIADLRAKAQALEAKLRGG